MSARLTSARRRRAGAWRTLGACGMTVIAAACRTPAPVPVPVTPAPTPAPMAVAPQDSVVVALAPWRPAPARLTTRFAADVRPDSVLAEYPRPQMVRARWQSLNGIWELAMPDSTSPTDGPMARGEAAYDLPRPTRPNGEGPAGPLPAPTRQAFRARILVPFAPEASLSGVGRHADRVAYRRTFQRPADMAAGERLLLHFGACDWHCTVYVNGRQVIDHTGGYATFSADVTDALSSGTNTEQELVVAVYDPTDAFGQPRGKQVSQPEGIWYTPVTGIWQSVWLEPVPATSIERLTMTPDVAHGVLRLTTQVRGPAAGLSIEAAAMVGDLVIGRSVGLVNMTLEIPIRRVHLWSPADPYLYGLRVRLIDAPNSDRDLDRVDSYFGMRSSGLAKDAKGFTRLALNGKPFFELGPLDQGWWPDGLYTAPTDAALRSDIETIKALGFGMVRKHIKVEPARWYYWADRLGLAVWQDMPSGWNDTPAARGHFESELRAMLEDLHNAPSIVTWVPFNEKWGQFDTPRIVGLVRQADSSRTINDVSGWQHSGAGDIVDVHRYQGPQAMFGTASRASVVGEFGGLGYKVGGHAWAGDAWGYGGLFPSTDSLEARYDLLVKRMWRLRDTHGMSAGVYTQLTDVEVELNGFMTYDRAVMKFDTARTAAVNRGLAPYILPELAEFTDAVRVEIAQGTPAVIRYTVDGSAPTATSPVYRAPFVVRHSTTVRARSFVNGAPTAAPEAVTAYQRVAGRAPELASAATRAVKAGVDYAYYRDTTTEPAYRMHWPVRWQLERPEVRPADVAPRRIGTSATISLAPADTNEMYGLRFTGYLRVPRTGVYTFTARSDDGAGLWIGDRNVFWSLGQSPATTETAGQIALQAGLHRMTLTYFQAYGPQMLELDVAGPGLVRQRVGAAMLFHDAARADSTRAAAGATR